MSNFEQGFGVKRGGTDEWYTPRNAVEVITPYIKPHSDILCPFDKAESQYVQVLTECGHHVLHSHIEDGKDFFALDKPDVDYVISNPPYSLRDKILTRLYEWDIPFAMLFNTSGLFDSKNRTTLAMTGGVEVMYIYPRVSYIGRADNSLVSPPFQSCYWCHNVLDEKIKFAILDRKI